jgi:O-antigen/teichoic acid export membrane protein
MIIVSAGAFFVANFVLKELVDEVEYGQYSIFVTYFSLIYVFGIFGTEQTFLRFSTRAEENIIETQKIQLYLIAFLATVSASLGTFFF